MKASPWRHPFTVAGAAFASVFVLVVAALSGAAAWGASGSSAGTPSATQPPALTVGPGSRAVKVAAFATEPVVLTGADFPGWTSGPETTARVPEPPTDYDVYDSQGALPAPLQSDCYSSSNGPDVNGATDPEHGDHNCFQGSQLPVRTVLAGVPPQALLGYRWDTSSRRFVQIPFQVDTKWQHYLSNNASGFAFYSGEDQILTYTFDEEPFRFTSNPPFSAADPTAVCRAAPPDGQVTTPDPNPSLTDTDELAFMAHDSGPRAPAGTALPAGIVQADQVKLVDPVSGVVRYVYVMESAMGPGGEPVVAPAYTAANSPYVHYVPDRNADVFAYSQSNYSNYGNAPKGPVCTVGPDGTPQPVVGKGFKEVNGELALDPSTYVQRRTLDIAQVDTPRYRFQYGDPSPAHLLAGRWIMDGLSVSPDDKGFATGDYGRSLVDRFKGRAFQQSPGGETPCCGYEDEQVNWNGSSITMGIRSGPVRVIRVTWGSDSGTNVTRTDTFYAYSIDHSYDLRVHPIPPLDGIYTQWNMNAGAVTTFYNPEHPKGVPVTGINPVHLGDTSDFVGPSGVSESSNDQVGRTEEQLNGGKPLTVGSPDRASCTAPLPVDLPTVGSPDDCIYGSFNTGDPTWSGPSPLTDWEELTGPAGTTVDKWWADTGANPSPGGAQSVVEAVPSYVDDSCFDDGTGNSPGPQVEPRQLDPTTWGFEDVNGAPVAVSPAPPIDTSGVPVPGESWPSKVTKDGRSYLATGEPYQRRCWNHDAAGKPYNIPGTATYDAAKPAQAEDPVPDPAFGPQGDVRYFEGDIATHGLHLLFASDTDNAQLTADVDEADSVDHQMVLGPNQKDVGALYAAQFTTPVQGVVTPFGVSPAALPTPDVRGPGMASTPVSGPSGTGSSNPSASESLTPAAPGPAPASAGDLGPLLLSPLQPSRAPLPTGMSP